jgi:hypothetical protein
MSMRNLLLTVLATAALALPVATLAHHSFAAEFDANAPVEISGYVTKVEWTNPHVFFFVDVETEDGEFQNWAIELASPNGLMRRGWTRNSMQIGDVVTVTGTRARDGSYKANARAVALANGQRLFAGSSQGLPEE